MEDMYMPVEHAAETRLFSSDPVASMFGDKQSAITDERV